MLKYGWDGICLILLIHRRYKGQRMRMLPLFVLDTTDNPNGIVVSFDVRNTGGRDGAEVAQLYIHQPKSKLIRPFKELKGFSKVFLQAGETKRVNILLDSTSFMYFKPYIKTWGLDYTRFEIMVGSSSRDIRLTGNIELQSPDQTTPVVTGLAPTGNTSSKTGQCVFKMIFNKPVYFNPDKWIIIKEYDTDKTKEIIDPWNIEGSGTSIISFYNKSSLLFNSKYYALVDSAAFFDFYENNFAGISGKDTWSFTISVTGLNDHDLTMPFLNLYPNPTKDMLVIDFRMPSDYQPYLQIVDIVGRVMAMKNLPSKQSGTTEFDCSMLKSGFYFVKLTSENGVLVRKFIKE